MSNYETLAAINVNDRIEKKNGLSYLSWAWAVDTLMRHDPDASWTYGEPMKFGKDTWMVSCSVTAFGKTMTAQLPVMDHRNKAISDPDSFAFNTAMQRCLVKAIALHGLGLYIYAGEDVPKEAEQSAGVFSALDKETQEWLLNGAMEVTAQLAKGDAEGAHLTIERMEMDADLYAAFWSQLDSKQRSTLKAYGEIARADSLEKLKEAWEKAPKHAHLVLGKVKDQRKEELSQPEAEAA